MPTRIKYDSGNELMGHAFKNYLIENTHGIKSKYETTANPQANSISERIHQVIANLVSAFVFIGTNIPYVSLVLTTSNRTRLKHISMQNITAQPKART